MAKMDQVHGSIEEIDAGESLLSWETLEFPKQERGTRWYVVSGVIAVALLVYSIYSTNYLFAIIILMVGVLTLVNSMRNPRAITVHLTTLGIVVGDDFHSFKEIKDFSLIYEPPQIKLLYVSFVSRWHPMIAVPLEEIDPNAVREILLPYVFENIDREEEGLTDMLRRVYKI